MDSYAIHLDINTPVEVRFSFSVLDVYGHKHPAMFRFRYPLFFKEYFKRPEKTLIEGPLRSVYTSIHYTRDTLYCDRKEEFINKSLSGFSKLQETWITFSPDTSSLSFEQIEEYSRKGLLKAIRIKLPLYVNGAANTDDLLLEPLSFDYPIKQEWIDIILELNQLNNVISGNISRNELSRLYYDVYFSGYSVDSIITLEEFDNRFKKGNDLILEAKTYRNIPGTTKTYRIDPANTNTVTQKHIHVFFDGKQIYALNVDGTPHEALFSLDLKHKEGKEIINIFDILDLQTKETRHSMIIAELLNPEGSHGCGYVFLNNFIKTVFKEKGYNEFSVENAKVKTEDCIGDKGRLDIILWSANGSSAIIIENKIYAEDQKEQLKRYYEYATKQFKDFRILYLTLNGKTASDESCCDLEIGAKGYIPISYDKHIIEWLDLCLAERKLVEKPRVKDIIQQYLETVKKITNKDMELTREDILNTIFREEKKNACIDSIIKYLEFEEKVNSVLDNLEKCFDDYLLECLQNIDGSVIKEPGWSSWKTDINKNGIKFIQLFRENNSLYCGLALSEPDKHKELIENMNEDQKNHAYYRSYEANSKGYKEALMKFEDFVKEANKHGRTRYQGPSGTDGDGK